MDLIKLDSTVPIKAIPEEELNRIIYTEFSYWICELLSLTGETSSDRLEIALPAIKKHFWSLGMHEVKKAFLMYADGKLTTQPIPNYFDRILVGQIFNDYKMHQRQNSKPTTEFDKEAQDFMYCVTAFDYFQQNTALPEQAVWLYEYLTGKGVLSVSKKEKQTAYSSALGKYENKDMATLKSKLWLIEHYFSTLLAKDKHIKDEL